MEITEPEKETLDRALGVVVSWSGLKPTDILGRRRFQQLVDARHFFWMLCLKTGEFTILRLSELVDRDHGAIIHARHRHNDMLEVGQHIFESETQQRTTVRNQEMVDSHGTKNYRQCWRSLVLEYGRLKLETQLNDKTHGEEHTHSLV